MKRPSKPAKSAAKKGAAKKAAKKGAHTGPAKKSNAKNEASASHLISMRIAELGDWRGDVLRQVREVILSADSGIIEEWKWSVPVWSCDGILCTGEVYKKAVKLTFAKGATPRSSSTRASKATPAAPSTFRKANRSTSGRWVTSFVPPWL